MTHPDATRIADKRMLRPRWPIPMFGGAALSDVVRSFPADVGLALR